MADYIVNFTDPVVPAIIVKPRTVNGPGSSVANTSLRLFGDGHTSWGEAVNENFVRLLEHFMGATAPINPVTGQLWVEAQLFYHDTNASIFYQYDIDPSSINYKTWQPITVVSQATAPAEVIGTYWFNTGSLELFYFASAYDLQPATWMLRSMGTGVVAPTGTPPTQVKVFDATVGASGSWVGISAVLVSDSTSPPSDGQVGSLRFAPTGDTLHVWTGTAWTTLVNADSPVFTNDLNMSGNHIINLANPVNPTDALNLQTGDSLYVNVSGDTMTGALILSGDATAPLQATTLQQVQPIDPTLTAFAQIATGADQLAYSTGVDQFAQISFNAAARLLLTDMRFSGIYAEKINDLGSVTVSQTIDNAAGTYVKATVTGNVTFTFTNPTVAGYVSGFMLELTNGGAFVITWPASVKWPGGVNPVLTAAGVDMLVFTTADAGVTWRGNMIQKDSK